MGTMRVEEASLVATADAIREKIGEANPIEWVANKGFADSVAGIQAGGGQSVLDSVVDGTVTELVSNARNVETYKFYKNKNLSIINLSKATWLKDYAFYGCSALSAVNCPKVTTIGEYCFSGNQGAPKLTEISNVNFPSLTTINTYAFANCIVLEKVDIHAVTTLSTYVFSNCSALSEVNCPKVTRINKGTFSNCVELIVINIPLVTSIETSGFYGCSKLELLDAPLVKSISSTSFNYCTMLTKLILRSETLCSLSNVSAFNNTPFASGGTGGTIYVPEALIESYKTATNWSTLYDAGTCNFVAIEGSEYDTTT